MLDGDIGYVPLQRFNDVASRGARRAVQRLRQQGAKGLILDLRGNPGGDLDESIKVANVFLPPGTKVVEVRYPQPAHRSARRRPAARERRSAARGAHRQLHWRRPRRSSRARCRTTTAPSSWAPRPSARASCRRSTRSTRAVPQDHQREVVHAERALHPARPAPRRPGRLGRARPFSAPCYKSDAGRQVYGGGGIVPDVTVFADTLTDGEQQAAADLLHQVEGVQRGADAAGQAGALEAQARLPGAAGLARLGVPRPGCRPASA
jgi:carboxyl-terminal processing protease